MHVRMGSARCSEALCLQNQQVLLQLPRGLLGARRSKVTRNAQCVLKDRKPNRCFGVSPAGTDQEPLRARPRNIQWPMVRRGLISVPPRVVLLLCSTDVQKVWNSSVLGINSPILHTLPQKRPTHSSSTETSNSRLNARPVWRSILSWT